MTSAPALRRRAERETAGAEGTDPHVDVMIMFSPKIV